MKRNLLNLLILGAAVLALSTIMLAQNETPSTYQQDPFPQPQGQQVPTQQPGQQPPQQQDPMQQPQAQSQPAPTNQPQAKTQEEYNAFMAAANQSDTTAAENAAKEFSDKYPDSQLRGPLYSVLMTKYQQANNGEKSLEMARKVIEFEPNNPVALVVSATVLADGTRLEDANSQQRFSEAQKNAELALQKMDTDLVVPANVPPEQVETSKKALRSMAHESLGTIALKRNDAAAAEKHFRDAIDVNPDAVTWFRLSLALDAQQKYPDALAAVDKAVGMAQPGSSVANAAQQERERLLKLTGGTAQPETQGATRPSQTPASGQQPATQQPAPTPR
jgi:tetratricopeptide (TPR) repeat protein